MSKRKKVSENIEEQILVESGRRCCLCFGLSGDLSEKRGQIAHLDHDASNNAPQNLAFLCLEHHDQYDSKTSQSKGIKIGEVRRYRALLLVKVAEIREKTADDSVVNKQSLEPAAAKIYYPVKVNENAINNRGIYFLYEDKQYRLPAFTLADVPVVREYPDYQADGNDALTWGYSGEGPRWTAYSILRDLYNPEIAKRYYFSFEQLVISKLSRSTNWILTSDMVRKWLKTAPSNNQLLD